MDGLEAAGRRSAARSSSKTINQAADDHLAEAAAIAEETYCPLVEAAAHADSQRDSTPARQEPPRLTTPVDRSSGPRNLLGTTPPHTPPHTPIQRRLQLIATSPHIGSDEDASVEDEDLSVESAIAHDASNECVEDDNDSAHEDPDSGQTTTVEDSTARTQTVGNDDDEDDETLGAELLADTDDGLNTVSEGNIAADYGTIESGDDAEQDDVDSNDEEEVPAEYYVPEDEDEGEQSESEIAAEVLFAEHFPDRFSGENEVLAGNLKNDVLRSMEATGWKSVEVPDTDEFMRGPYEPVNNNRIFPGLRQGYSGPSAEALRNADSPVALLFFFLPVVLCQHIAACSNQYHREMLPMRVEERYKRYRRLRIHKPDLSRKTRRNIRHELEGMKTIRPHELCRFVGLLITRTIAPNREKFANHWKLTDEGGISRGSFGSMLRRDRFMGISRNLHFNPNNDTRAQTDRAWKIRKVVGVLHKTFVRGYISPSHLAFDEAILPSRSSFNKMRVYMKDKPRRWGTKLFMLYSAVSAYCIRFEVYCGKKQHTSDAHKTDMKSGPAAVVRNLLAVFGPDSRKRGMRLVAVDRFYTSVALAIQLLLMGFYCVGTIMTNRLGYCKSVVEKKKKKKRSASIIRCTHKLAQSKLVPNMTAISWWDSRPVHFLNTGGSLETDRVVRQEGPSQVEIPCPRVVKDYYAFMGGVDVHDQLRLQRYSIQRSLRFRKYYKSLVLGLIDLAIVNGYIIHKAFHKNKTSRPLSHVNYMKKLHLQLGALQASDMYESNTFGTRYPPAQSSTGDTAAPATDAHVMRELGRRRDTTTQPKRRRTTCKVCSILHDGKRAPTSKFYCLECNKTGPIFLCRSARYPIRGVAMTCWDI